MLVNFRTYLFTQLIVGSLYYLVSKITPFPPIEMGLGAIDIFVKPHYSAPWIYMSFFFLLIAGVTFTSSRENSINCSRTVIINSLFASIFFIFLPTKITFNDYAPYIMDNTLSGAFMQIIKKYDNTSNCFPSLHIANSIIATIYLNKDKKTYLKVINVIWLLAVVWSVLSTKQHTLYDVVGGTILAFTSLMIYNFYIAKQKRPIEEGALS